MVAVADIVVAPMEEVARSGATEEVLLEEVVREVRGNRTHNIFKVMILPLSNKYSFKKPII